MINNSISLAITGASGIPYAMRLLAQLLKANERVNLLISPAARTVFAMETDFKLPGETGEIKQFFSDRFNTDPTLLTVYGHMQWMAPIASGSAISRAMVICPCTSGCLAAIANGTSDNLIERAADVTLKENKRLIVVHRETPLSIIQLENMLKLARAGATLLPANPGFYHQPKQIDDLVDFVVARILDHLEVPHTIGERWSSS